MADTPLMIQYKEMKKQYSDMVLFFRLGDFYEMFDQDAIEVSSLLNLTLTHKGDSPMCGIPYHAARNYIKRLLDSGKKIAVCEQLELSDSAKALAKREVVRIITPATVVEEDFVDDSSFNWILSVFRDACAFCDITTGDFHLRYLDKQNRIQSLRSLIEQIMPKEILVCEDEYFMDMAFKDSVDLSKAMVTKLPPWYFSIKNCYKLMCDQAQVANLFSFGLDENSKTVSPAGALLRYVKETSKSSVSHLTDYKTDTETMYVSMDESSRKNLELFNNLYDGSSKFTLFDSINKCKTSSGLRLLKNWLSFPLRIKQDIEYRQSWVKFFVTDKNELDRVRGLLTQALDLNRLTTRALLKKAVPHDLTAIKQSIGTFLSIVSEHPEKYSQLFEVVLNESDSVSTAVDLMKEIDQAIDESFLGQFNAGQVILSGYDKDLDEKRNLKYKGDDILKQYLEEEKAKTGITIMKLGYNRVFGYYLEIPNGQVPKAPSYFLRKQTLVNGERFTTETLQSYEQNILRAGAAAEEREKELFDNLVEKVTALSAVLNSMGHFLSVLDVYQSLGSLALDSNYVCPEISEEDVLCIRDGRHPVVEKQLGLGKFVPNDLDMSVRLSLITGPNMAGKSTYLRQNALIILLAHIGSFVPASYAKIGITDKIFCRVGASDNLARGESTFLLEMQEAAYILRSCTERSFVIVDEIGRGTSTQDGMSIAYAVLNSLAEKNVKTLFATHYHELTMIDTHGIRLLTLDVLDDKGTVTFLRKVKEGVANSSYGIHVAKMAGVPSDVIKKAKQFQSKHFADYSFNQGDLFAGNDQNQGDSSFEYIEQYKAIVSQLREINPDEITPMQAMILLAKLKEETLNIQ